MSLRILCIALVFGLLSIPVAMAAENGPGCGVGKKLWGGKKGFFPHTTAGSTNGSSGQPFSVTSGTSGCDSDQVILLDKEQEHFVASNFDSITQDVAQGQGEYLTSLATLMGCPVMVQSEFAQAAQQEFGTMPDVALSDSQLFLSMLKEGMNRHSALSSQCQRIS